jgi:hypothetical protein
MAGCTRVRPVNDLTAHTTTVESPRERAAVFFDLVKIARRANRKNEEALRMSVHLTAESIIIHFHTTTISEIGTKFNADLLALGDPIRETEQIVWGKGGVA